MDTFPTVKTNKTFERSFNDNDIYGCSTKTSILKIKCFGRTRNPIDKLAVSYDSAKLKKLKRAKIPKKTKKMTRKLLISKIERYINKLGKLS